MFLYTTLLSLLVCLPQEVGSTSNSTYGRSVFHILGRLTLSMERGATLKGKSIADLQDRNFFVRASGGFHNLLKWPLHLAPKGEETHSGVINCPIPTTVKAGYVEGFASRKSDRAPTGTMVRHSWIVDDDIMIHFMYSAPFAFTYFNKNFLAVAACLESDQQCRSLEAYDMCNNEFQFLKRKIFYDPEVDLKDPVGVCVDEVCVMGWMTTSHHPIVRVFAFPKNYYDLDFGVREKSGVSLDDYQWFVEHLVD